MDNILFMQEVMKNNHKTGGDLRCALEINIQKAYDSIRWSFLLEVLEAMHFPLKMKSWIFECVTTVQYYVSMNGYLEGIFKGGRGLR